MSPLRYAIVVFGLLFLVGSAHAATVTLLRPSRASAEVTETLSRLRGEIRSLGLDPVVVDPPAETGTGDAIVPAWLGNLTISDDFGAVIEIVAGDAVAAVNVWTIRKSAGTWQLLRIDPDPKASNQPESLALRAVEALRARLLVMGHAAPQTTQSSGAKEGVVAGGTIPLAQTDTVRRRFALEAGVAGMMGLDGVGPAFSPVVGVDWAVRPWLSWQVAWAGAGTRATVAASMGKAWIARQYGVLGACFRLRHERRVWPVFGMAAGVLHSRIDGQAEPGAEGGAESLWSFLLDARLGAGLRLSPRVEASMSVHVQTARPYLVVHVADGVAATVAHPTILLTLTLGAWL